LRHHRLLSVAFVLLAVAIGSAAIGVAAAAAATPKPKPSIASITVSTTHISASGGTVVLGVQVRNASSCTFKGQVAPQSSVSVLLTKSCSSGHARATVTIAVNRHKSAQTIQFYVRAVGAGGRIAQKGITVREAAAATSSTPTPTPNPTPTPAPAPSVPALSITTTSLPGATVGVAYSASLSAAGGTPPYAWTVASGSLPAGVTVSTGGVLSGTPTQFGQASFTLQVSDATTPATKTATQSFSVGISAPSPQTVLSTNWSGYAALGGPFTSVSGTFTVPNLTSGPVSTSTSEWVGIDGATSNDQSLIQAGVAENYNAGTNLVSLHAWWEILPAAETPISMTVSPGNTITVVISQLSGSTWQISIANTSTGQNFTTQQSYSGSLSSAEWIVEAPGSQIGNQVIQTTLGQYSPNVTFTNVSTTGAEGSLMASVMVQGGTTVSQPSALTPAGFTVAYGSTVPSPPG
jgi:hypothetical protein